MALSKTYSTHGTEAPLPRLVESICLTVVIAEAAFLVGSLLKGTWLIAPHGGWVESDFVDVWAAGRLALAGYAAMAYDWSIHKLAEDSAFGHRFDGYYAWYYPPTFLFVAAVLASLPYAVAYLVWTIGTFPLYLTAIRGHA